MKTVRYRIRSNWGSAFSQVDSKSKAKCRGFTMIELMIVLAALGVLLAISLPSFQDVLDGVNTDSRVDEMITTFGLARSEAIKRGTQIHICATNTAGSDCETDEWSRGWIVFEDANGDADGSTGSIDAGDEIIRVFGTGRNASAITITAPLVTFDTMGFNATGAIQQIEILPYGTAASHARCIELSIIGRPLVTEDECP
ncbi:MAG: GspH/FimT family pseudopilin [Gammaproteobacteria bacterium]|nr:GspH/FimT family pseudopilin [Pseudomonadales bacterium]MCP5345673.1 GspH/FimT family pseudopilin [Pseudomonadales bacterium]